MHPRSTSSLILRRLPVLAGLLASTALTGVARSATLSVAADYNVFIFGSMTETNVDSEGRIAIGGDANLTNFGVGSTFQSNPASAGDTLVVGGNLTYNGGEVHYGNAYYAGSLTGAVSAPNGSVIHSSLIDFPAAQATLTSYSDYWANLTPTAGTSVLYGGDVRLIGTSPTLNIFSLSGSDLNSAYSVSIDAPAGSTVLVNISGVTNDFDNLGISFTDLNSDSTGITDKQHVLYNFYESISLSISGISVKGSILAPFAAVSFGNGNVEGNLIANSLTGSGEAHNYLFNGSIPVPAPVPEPGAPALLATGVLTMILRRQRSKA